MGYSDPLKRILARRLARGKSQDLQKEVDGKTDAMRQYEYAVARQSILGQFSSEPLKSSQDA